MSASKINKGLTTSVWIVYILIVFEILYMISPFAFYYYSVYSIPLKLLQETPLTAWLAVHLLPHFSYQTSLIISVLLLMSWPLILLGLVLFLVAFIQIYWAKFLRKGTVTGGLYKYIRHPQYLALAIIGLGTTIYWPRFIVFIMYAVMLFLYYFLARQEEKICLKKFGPGYQNYLAQTGMFFPKWIENRLPDFPALLPEYGFKRVLSILGILIIYIAAVVILGVGIKNYALTKIAYTYTENLATVSVAPLNPAQINKAISITYSDPNVKQKTDHLNKQLVYILPTGWDIPELGVKGDGQRTNYFLHPETHGNSLDFDPSRLTLLVTEPIMISNNIKGKDILKKSLTYNPIMEVVIDLNESQVDRINLRSNRGRWDGTPVPIY